MPSATTNWVQVTPSEFPWEQRALQVVRDALPRFEPYSAWANFELVTQGTISEIDLLLVTPKGVFLVEIKSWPGVLEGNAHQWQNRRAGGVVRTMENPLLLTNRKAKRLKSLLGRQAAFKREQVPYVAPAVFLSDSGLGVQLPPDARDGIYGLPKPNEVGSGEGTATGEIARGHTQRGGLPGIVAGLIELTNAAHQDRRKRIDRPTAKRIGDALAQAGIRPSTAARKVGELELGELLGEGPGYQDFDAAHARDAHLARRVRIYGATLEDEEERDRAERAANREFRLLGALQHPGILRAVDARDMELGSAVVFERDRTEQPLDHVLAERGSRLDVFERLAVVREIGEALAYAHGKRLYHRALSPSSVLVVRPGTAEQRIVLADWQTGLREEGETRTSAIGGTAHVGELVRELGSAYLAPESVAAADADPGRLDVYSLGAIAYLVLTGEAPGDSLEAVTARLRRDGALKLAAVQDGAAPVLEEFVATATQGDPLERFASVRDLLDGLTIVEDELTLPESDPAPASVDPLAARPGDRLGEFTMVGRLGRGSTALALLVEDDDGARHVLKVAVDPAANDRLREEREALVQLRHDAIIGVRGEPLDLDGHLALDLDHADQGTLAQWLSKHGPVTLEYLQPWGEDLLAAIDHLERAGVAHRDIKPENVGVATFGHRRERRLRLFDFSLARAPVDATDVGTRPYLDPFLGSEERPRWDVAAERFAAAMVLHEMATGAVPHWGGRGSDPQLVQDEVRLAEHALPEEIGEPLAAFLRTALRRDARERFGTAADMLAAWRRMFDDLDRGVHREAGDRTPLDEATYATPITALELEPRAVDVLRRNGVDTVADLLGLPPLWITSMRGISVATRGGLTAARRELRERLGAPAGRTVDEEDVRQLAELSAQLLPSRVTEGAPDIPVLRRFLELDAAEPGRWPGSGALVGSDLSSGDVDDVLRRARGRWLRLPALTRVRAELDRRLGELAGVAELGELERAIGAWWQLAEGQDVVAGDVRACLRAAVDAELQRARPRFAWQRVGGARRASGTRDAAAERIVVTSLTDDAELDDALLAAQERADHVAALATRADDLVREHTTVAPARVIAALQAVPAPPGGVLAAERLVRLAAGASRHAGASAVLELHPRPLAPAAALGLARHALLSAGDMTADQVRRRVAARLPDADPLPDRPELDALLRTADLELRWDDAKGSYVAPKAPTDTSMTSYGSPTSRAPTATTTSRPATAGRPLRAVDGDVAEAAAFERRLDSAVTEGGVLTLLVDPAEAARVAGELGRRWGLELVDLDAGLLRHLHAAAGSRNVRWDLVLGADARPDSSDWRNLQVLVAAAADALSEELCARPGTLVLQHLGLLARYDRLDLVDALRTATMAPDGLRGALVVVPADGQSERPMVDRRPVPVLASTEWARVPRSWVRNVHRSADRGHAA